jgi:hypothetical protein
MKVKTLTLITDPLGAKDLRQPSLSKAVPTIVEAVLVRNPPSLEAVPIVPSVR